MPRGWVNCRYVGGHLDGKTETMSGRESHKLIRVLTGRWFEAGEGGKLVAMNGHLGANWVASTAATYEKSPRRRNDGGVTYTFVAEVLVERCAKVLEVKGRRCKNIALEGVAMCRDHEKIRLRGESPDRSDQPN